MRWPWTQAIREEAGHRRAAFGILMERVEMLEAAPAKHHGMESRVRTALMYSDISLEQAKELSDLELLALRWIGPAAVRWIRSDA